MSQGKFSEASVDYRTRFWAKQYEPQVTPGQVAFDFFGGALLPLICLWFDPLVFQSNGFGEPMLAKVKVAAYCFIVVQIATLIFWLSFGRHLGHFAGIQAGILFAGALGSGLLGIVLFPFSLIGLLAVIGVLGFSPFLVAWIFLRNWLRARRNALRSREPFPRLSCWVAGCLVVVVPIVVQPIVMRQTSQLLSAAVDGNEPATGQALKQLSRWSWVLRALANMDKLAIEFERETDSARRDRIAMVYETVAAERVEDRLDAMRD